jgi:hypothetical protein
MPSLAKSQQSRRAIRSGKGWAKSKNMARRHPPLQGVQTHRLDENGLEQTNFPAQSWTMQTSGVYAVKHCPKLESLATVNHPDRQAQATPPFHP